MALFNLNAHHGALSMLETNNNLCKKHMKSFRPARDRLETTAKSMCTFSGSATKRQGLFYNIHVRTIFAVALLEHHINLPSDE